MTHDASKSFQSIFCHLQPAENLFSPFHFKLKIFTSSQSFSKDPSDFPYLGPNCPEPVSTLRPRPNPSVSFAASKRLLSKHPCFRKSRNPYFPLVEPVATRSCCLRPDLLVRQIPYIPRVQQSISVLAPTFISSLGNGTHPNLLQSVVCLTPVFWFYTTMPSHSLTYENHHGRLFGAQLTSRPPLLSPFWPSHPNWRTSLKLRSVSTFAATIDSVLTKIRRFSHT